MGHEDQSRQSAPAEGGTLHLRRPPGGAPVPQDARPGTEGVGETVHLRPAAREEDQQVTVRMDVNVTRPFPAGGFPWEPPALPEPEPEYLAESAAEAGVLRFGPGVPAPGTARTVAVWQGTAPGPRTPPPAQSDRRRWVVRVLALLLVLLVIAGYLLWRRVGPTLAVASVSVAASPARLSCGGTEQLLATVRTNGGRGTLRYHWVRSDGTDSGPLTQSLPAGDHQVQLPLRWTVQGRGDFHGTATLDVTAPGQAAGSAEFTYACH